MINNWKYNEVFSRIASLQKNQTKILTKVKFIIIFFGRWSNTTSTGWRNRKHFGSCQWWCWDHVSKNNYIMVNLTNFKYFNSCARLYFNSLVAKPWASCTPTVALTFNRVTIDKNSSRILIYKNRSVVIYTRTKALIKHAGCDLNLLKMLDHVSGNTNLGK